jgi:hypothetical protein
MSGIFRVLYPSQISTMFTACANVLWFALTFNLGQMLCRIYNLIYPLALYLQQIGGVIVGQLFQGYGYKGVFSLLE